MKSHYGNIITVCLISSLLLNQTTFCASLTDVKIFFKGFIKNPSKVGAFFPCSISVGEEMTKYIVKHTNKKLAKPIRILEVGAGTGSLTEVIIQKMRKSDHLDVIEIDSEFCTILQEKFGKYPNVSIHCTSITEWEPDYSYDFIISTLPFNSFKYSFMQQVIDHLKSLIKQSGIFSYVAYAGIAQIKQPFLRKNAKKEHLEKMKVLNTLRKEYEIDKAIIFNNAPPICVYHLQLK